MTDLTLFIDVTRKQGQECFKKTGYTRIYIIDYLVKGNWGTENKVLRRLSLIYKYIIDQVSNNPRLYDKNYLVNLQIKSIVYIPETEVPRFDESLTRVNYEILDTPDYPERLPQNLWYQEESGVWWEWYRTEVLKELGRTDDEFIKEIATSTFGTCHASGNLIINLIQSLIGEQIPGLKKFEFEALRVLTKDVVCRL